MRLLLLLILIVGGAGWYFYNSLFQAPLVIDRYAERASDCRGMLGASAIAGAAMGAPVDEVCGCVKEKLDPQISEIVAVYRDPIAVNLTTLGVLNAGIEQEMQRALDERLTGLNSVAIGASCVSRALGQSG